MWLFEWCLRLALQQHAINKLSKLTNPDFSGFVVLVCPSRSYRVSQYIKAAKKLNYHLIIISDSKHSLVSAIADGIVVDFKHLEQSFNTVKDAIGALSIRAVLSTDDICAPLSSKIAAYLKLPHNDLKAAQLTFRKDLARQALKKADCNVPSFHIISANDIQKIQSQLSYPVVIKPLMLSASRGVMRVNHKNDFKNKCLRLFNIIKDKQYSLYEQQHILIERYLDGFEIALDGFIDHDQFQLMALFDKPEPLNGPYFEESYYITPSRHPEHIQQAIIDEVIRGCQAYGLTFGPIHAEARITNEGVFLIEMAARTIGGQCAQLLEYSLGIKLEELVLKLLCKETVEFERNKRYPGVLMIPINNKGLLKRVEGLLAAQQVKNIKDIEIHIQPGYELVPLPEGSSYLGFIFASSDSFEETYHALKKAHNKLKFITQETWVIE